MNATPLTLELAANAARLVVEEGLEYGPAKRRALRELGARANRSTELPSNELVEDEVRQYLQIFRAGSQAHELRSLRLLALEWMTRLGEFRPHLAGAVWRGTATRLSAIHIELYADDPKSPEIALLNLGIAYDTGGVQRNGAADTVLTLAARCAALNDMVTVHLTVLDWSALRGALKPDSRGRTWRGDTAALKRLLGSAPGAELP
jgi:hypothetical protein